VVRLIIWLSVIITLSVGIYISSESIFHVSMKALMSSIYEMNSYNEIVTRQVRNRSVYSSALSGNGFKYKYELLVNINPNILVLGSSRVMQFKEEMFNGSFANAGGAVNHIAEGILFVDAIKSKIKPEIVLVGLDYWWFNEDLGRTSFPEHNVLGEEYSDEKIFNLTSYLETGKVGYDVFKYTINNKYIHNPYTKHDSLGLSAITYGDGFRADGSRLYTSIIFGVKISDDIGFHDTIDRIKKGERRFNYASTLSELTKTNFLNLIEKVDNLSGQIIFFLPPFSGDVNDIMNEKRVNYAYIYELKKWLKTLNIILLDYTDVRLIGAEDCEFIDGFHGGDIVSQRMLLDMANNIYFLKPYINVQLIENNISKYAGRSMTPEFLESRGNVEVDFLKLGCNKGIKIH
jgi:hypothetical protein